MLSLVYGFNLGLFLTFMLLEHWTIQIETTNDFLYVQYSRQLEVHILENHL